ncbi:MAG: YfhO family protein [Verrucomicrobiales bacterium]|nr:YfhO family protein [Verrucomicrobiales bacterium]
MLGAILFWRGLVSPELVVSDAGADGPQYNYPHYLFVWEHFTRGEFPTWNPYICGGVPVSGAFSYALFYPLYWLCAFLPLSLAINWMVFLHVGLAGTGMYGWAVMRGVRPPGALLAGLTFMLSGPYIAHVPPGHFPHLWAMAWIPLIFLGIDGWLSRRKISWIALSAVAAAAQIYAGFPQYFYYTALVAGLYSLLALIKKTAKIKLAFGLLAIYPLAMLLAAAELLPAVLLLPGQMRANGVPAEWAASASLQFKDLLLIIVPGFFGKLGDWSYWDNEHLHEMWVYCGITGLFLAGFGWLKSSRYEKGKFLFLIMLALAVALGVHTPLFGILRDNVPLFASFRSLGRWTIFFALFMSLLAGSGLDKICSGEKIPRGLVLFFGGGGIILLLAGLLLYDNISDSWYQGFADWATYKPWFRQNLEFASRRELAQLNSAEALCRSGCFVLATSLILVLLVLFKKREWQIWLLIIIAAVDLVLFVNPLITYFNRAELAYPKLAALVEKFAPDDRNLNLVASNANILLKREGLWGYETVSLKRQVELIGTSQGFPLDRLHTDLPVYRNSKIFQLLRGRYALVPTSEGVRLAELQQDVLPRFLVVSNYRVLADRDEILPTLSAPDFDFRREVILERAPGLPILSAAAAPAASVKVLSSSASRWTVAVTTSAPSILLMTDSYANGWRATALNGSVQSSYALQPADWALRGIPLTVTGTHVLEIKYTPPGLICGLCVTAATLLALAAAFFLRKRRGMK